MVERFEVAEVQRAGLVAEVCLVQTMQVAVALDDLVAVDEYFAVRGWDLDSVIHPLEYLLVFPEKNLRLKIKD